MTKLQACEAWWKATYPVNKSVTEHDITETIHWTYRQNINNPTMTPNGMTEKTSKLQLTDHKLLASNIKEFESTVGTKCKDLFSTKFYRKTTALLE